MDLLGIGPFELIFLFVIVLLIFGPNDLVKTGKKLGRSLNQLVKSESWKSIQKTIKDLRQLPIRLAREAELEAFYAEDPGKSIAPPASTITKDKNQLDIPEGIKAWTTKPESTTAVEENRTNREEEDDAAPNHHQVYS